MDFERKTGMKHNDINEDRGTIFINNGIINEEVCVWKHMAFEKNKGDCKVFVETGTNTGNGVANALAVGFSEIHSIEIMEDKYAYAVERWKNYPNVHLYCGSSGKIISEVLSNINSTAFFWLDAHFTHADVLYEELEAIREHGVVGSTILIDDMTKYFNKEYIESILLNINPNYIFEYEPTPHNIEEILSAKVVR